MAITLDAALQAKLDTEERDPRLELTSSAAEDGIPFTGQRLHDVPEAEVTPDILKHSNGSYYIVYSKRDTANTTNLYVEISNSTRTSWTGAKTLSSVSSGNHWEYPNAFELSNGNIGVIFSERNGGVQKLRYLTIDAAGTVIAGAADLNTTGLHYESCAIKLNDGTYLCVSARNNGGTWEIVRFTHATGALGSWSAGSVLTFSGASVSGEKRRPCIREYNTGGLACWILFDRVDVAAGNLKQRDIYYSKNTASPYLSGSVSMTAATGLTNTFESDEGPSFVKPSTYPTANAGIMAYVFRTTSIKLNNTSSPQLAGQNSAYFIFYDVGRDYIIMVDRDPVGDGVYIIDAATLVTIKRFNTVSSPALHTTASFEINCAYYDSGKLVIGYDDVKGRFDMIDVDALTVSGILPFDTTDANVGVGDYRLSASIVTTPESIAIEGTKIWFITDETYSAVGPDGLRSLWTIDFANPTIVGIVRTITASRTSWVVENPDLSKLIGDLSDVDRCFQYFCHWDLPNRRVYVCLWSTSTPTTSDHYGRIVCLDIEDGSRVAEARFDLNSSFPKFGATCIGIDGDTMYFGIPIGDIYNNALGRMPMTIAGGVFTGTVTVDTSAPFVSALLNQQIRAIKPVGDGRLLIPTLLDGLAVYKNGTVIAIYDDVNIPAIPTITTPALVAGRTMEITDAVLDPLRNRIYLCLNQHSTWNPASDCGIAIFDLDGDIVQPRYREITGMDTGSPSVGGEHVLVTPDADDRIHICECGNTSSIAAAWHRQVSGSTTGEFDLMFDEDLGEINLLPYLTGKVRVIQTLEHQPNRLEFQVARGDLFDPLNPRSLFRYILDYGRRIVLKKGELISGVANLQTLFTGYVESGKQTYEKGKDGTRSVVVYDASKPSYDYEAILSPSYGDGTYPGTPDGDYPNPGAIAHLAFTLMNFKDTEISIGSFGTDSVEFREQLVNMSPADMLELLCNRFFRTPYVRYDGVLVAKKIAKDNAIDDTFSTNALTTKMNPKEGEGESTNKITVRSTSSAEIAITYSPERITQITGTASGGINPQNSVRAPNLDIYIPYSDDLSRACKNPTMVWKRWTSIIFPRPATFTPYTAQDIINRPDLYNNPLVSGISPDDIARFYNERGARLFLNTQLYQGPTDNWEYILEIWAEPTGSIGQEIQASWNDYAHQQRMRGHVIERIIDFPGLDSIASCQALADWFGFRVQLTRRLASLTQMGHLRQEPGDTIRFKHPMNDELLTAIIIEIAREFERAPNAPDEQTLTVGVFE